MPNFLRDLKITMVICIPIILKKLEENLIIINKLLLNFIKKRMMYF